MKNLKRLALLLASVMMFFALTACSSQPTTPSVTNPETNTTTTSKGEVELVDQGGVKIVLIGGLNMNSSYIGPELKLRIENSSGHDITRSSLERPL